MTAVERRRISDAIETMLIVVVMLLVGSLTGLTILAWLLAMGL